MKQKINLHTHSTFSDGKNTAEEHVLSAIEKGFTVLGFSEHSLHPLDPDFYSAFDSNWHMIPENFPKYVAGIKALKEKYADRIKLLIGFEADYFYSPEIGLAAPDKKAYAEFSPDYLIGSVHFIVKDKGFFTVDHKPEIVKENLIRFYSKADGTIDGKAAVYV